MIHQDDPEDSWKKREVVQLADENALGMGELHPSVQALLDAAKVSLRTHFRRREALRTSDLVRQVNHFSLRRSGHRPDV